MAFIHLSRSINYQEINNRDCVCLTCWGGIHNEISNYKLYYTHPKICWPSILPAKKFKLKMILEVSSFNSNILVFYNRYDIGYAFFRNITIFFLCKMQWLATIWLWKENVWFVRKEALRYFHLHCEWELIV